MATRDNASPTPQAPAGFRVEDWRGQNVLVKDVLEHLSGFSRQADANGSLPVRATVLNLVAYSDGHEHYAGTDWESLYAAIAYAFATRLIALHSGKGDGQQGHVDVQMHAWYRDPPGSQGSSALCAEVVDLQLYGALTTHWIDLVQSVVLPGIPVYLWWLGRLPDLGFRWDLASSVADHFILDSWHEAPWVVAQTVLQAKRSGMVVDDVNWLRLAAWRLAAAELADDSECLAFLSHPSALAVTLGDELGVWEALYVLAWMASRLGWVVTQGLSRTEQGWSLTFEPADDGSRGPVPVTLTPGSASRLELLGSPERASLGFTKSDVVGHFEGTRGNITRRCKVPDQVEQLLLESLHQGHDVLFDAVWQQLLTLLPADPGTLEILFQEETHE